MAFTSAQLLFVSQMFSPGHFKEPEGRCKNDHPFFGFGSTLKLEKQFLNNLKNMFNVYTFKIEEDTLRRKSIEKFSK